MSARLSFMCAWLIGLGTLLPGIASAQQVLPGTERLTDQGDFARKMVDGINQFLLEQLRQSVARRKKHWHRDFSSPGAYARSVEPNRRRLAYLIGVNDKRLPPADPFLVATTARDALVAQDEQVRVRLIRWSVLPGVDGVGLLLEPATGSARANVVLLGDCDQLPEQLAGLTDSAGPTSPAALLVARAGLRVVVPLLIDRSDRFSALRIGRKLDIPHREFVYRAGYQVGRHPIGYEVQKVLALVDWFRLRWPKLPVGVAGYGEGGLVAFYSAALDERIDAALVSGYFQSRQRLWREPIYRNVYALLEQFGDAEIASLVAPRALVLEAAAFPKIKNVPPIREKVQGRAAPGELITPPVAEIQAELDRAKTLLGPLAKEHAPVLVVSGGGRGPGLTWSALRQWMRGLGLSAPETPPSGRLRPRWRPFADGTLLREQLWQLIDHTQQVLRDSDRVRQQYFAKLDLGSLEAYEKSCRAYRERFRTEVIGDFELPLLPPRPRTRLLYRQPSYTAYEVVLDVYPQVIAYGWLLVPKGLAAGERRPVVVCQHGLEGRPRDLAHPEIDHPAYHRFACRLAERGFVVFAPQNPYIGMDRFRTIQRKAYLLKKTLFAVITAQHRQITDWLASLPFVDPQRIAFYGLSYGGKTAMRVPVLVSRYCLSICSADFDRWNYKNASVDNQYTYVGTIEYEMFEYDMAHWFDHAEMAWLIAPRPFMVERGHFDAVAPDEWVGYEFARVRRVYDLLGIGSRCEIEWFVGPHTINGKGTFRFLHRHLNWPEPKAAP